MTINRYTEAWCYEKYTPDRESFFVDNAYYVLDREWNSICNKVMVFAPLACMVMQTLGLQTALGFAAVVVFTYFMYGVRKIDANDVDMKHPSLWLAGFLCWSLFKLPDIVIQIFIGINIVLYIYMAFFKTAHYKKNRKRVEQHIDEEDYREEEETKKYYSSWKKNSYSEPVDEQPQVNNADPLELEAEKMFYGYTDNKDILKTRYRQLAKIHHPDHGGNEELFKRINNFYEYHYAKFAS